MPGLWMDAAKKIDENFLLSCCLVLLLELSSLLLSLPFAWPCYLLAGYIFWRIDIADMSKTTSLFSALPILILMNSSVADLKFIFTLNFALAIGFEGMAIYILRRTNSWTFLVEVFTVIFLALTLLLTILAPNLTLPLQQYIAQMQGLKPDEISLPLGLLLSSTAVEVMLCAWMSSRMTARVRPMSEALLASAREIRVGVAILLATLLVPLILYLLGISIDSFKYGLAFPYVIAGVSLLSWVYLTHRNSKKNSNKSIIWLIFIFLYATFMPLALGLIGLIDVGLNLIEKYQNYLKRR